MLPPCPVCGEDELGMEQYGLDGQLHYRVTCGGCGVEYEHHGFDGVNATVKFFEDNCEAQVGTW